MCPLLPAEKKQRRPQALARLLALLLLLGTGAARAQTPDPRPVLQLDLLDSPPSTLVDPTYIYFQAGATPGRDSQFDASKLSNPTGLNLASFTSAGPVEQLVINGLPPYVAGTPLAINLFVGVPDFGRFRFRLASAVNFGDTHLVLRDNLLNVRTPLVVGTTYAFDMTFANTSGRYNDPARFVLEILPPGDLVVSSVMTPPLDYYRNVTITGTGRLQLDKNLEANTSFTLQTGGTLDTGTGTGAAPGGYVLTGPAFAMQPGSSLVVRSPNGLAATGAQGNIQTTARSFSPDGLYTYKGSLGVGEMAFTGTGLPATARYLGAAVTRATGGAAVPGPGTLRLTQPLALSQRLDLFTNLDTNGQALTLQSSQTGGTALVGDISGTLTGPLTQERAIDPTLNAGAGYRHFSNPFGPSVFGLTAGPSFVPVVNAAYNTSATPNLLTPFPNLYTYDFTAIAGSPATTYSAFDRGWRALAPGDAAPGRGRGFIAHISADNLLKFSGTLNEVAQAVALPANPGGSPGFVLLGNPFVAPLDGTLLTRPASVPAAFYVFETTGPYAGRYRANVNGQGGSPIIPTGQGFFVSQNAGAAAATLTVPLAARQALFGSPAVPTLHRPAATAATATTATTATTADLRPRLTLALTAPGTAADGLVLYAEAGATPAFDPAFDAHKLPSPGQAELAALTPTREALAISGLPVLSATQATLVPLRLRLPRAGSFALGAALANFAGLDAYLLDALTGQRHNLRAAAAYPFAAATAGEIAGRFTLQLGGAARPTAATAGALAAAVSLYPNPAHGSATVAVPAVPGVALATAVLRDALGREVRRQSASVTAAGGIFELNLNGLPAGLYALQLALGEQLLTRQLVVE